MFTTNEFRKCRCIRSNESQEVSVAFIELQKGDTVFVNGEPMVVTVDAHYSGDASYDGYLLYAGDDNEGYFPDDLDGKD